MESMEISKDCPANKPNNLVKKEGKKKKSFLVETITKI